MTNHPGLPRKVPHPLAHGSSYSPSAPLTLIKSPPGSVTEDTKGVWQALAMWAGRSLLKSLGKGEEAKEALPTHQGMSLSPLTWISFVFRSENMKDTWKEYYGMVTGILERFPKYGCCFSSPGVVHKCLHTMGTGGPQVRNLDGILKQETGTDSSASNGSQQLCLAPP